MVEKRRQRWRILAVDDDPTVLDFYREILHQQSNQEIDQGLTSLGTLMGTSAEVIIPHFDLDTEISGEAGFQRVVEAITTKDPYAVICLDMRMPNGWDGLHTAERIREVDQKVKIIFITAHMDYSLTDIRSRIGISFDFLAKPLEHNEFLQLTISLAESWSQFRELVQAKQELEAYREQLTVSLALEKEHTELIVESMREGVVVVDRLGNIAEINPRMEQLLGRNEMEVAGRPLGELFIASDGRKQIDNLSLSTIELQKNFQFQEESLARKIEASMLALLVVDGQGRILQCNHAMEELSGWHIDQMVGNSIDLLMPPEVRRRHGRMMAAFMEKPVPRKMGGARVLPLYQADQTIRRVEIALIPIHVDGLQRVIVLLHDPCEVQKLEVFRFSPLGSLFVDEQDEEEINADWELRHKSGEVVPVNVSGSPLYREMEGKRRFNGVVLVVRDLRNVIRAESAIQANKAKDDFLASMSHELRTPLAAIIGNSEMLMDELWEQLSDGQHDMLRVIEVAGRTQLALVNDILDLSKISAGKFEIDEIDYDLNTMIREVADIFTVRTLVSGLDFRVEAPEGLTHQVVGDVKRTGQILINLLSNAVKFTEEGEVTLRVWIGERWIHFDVIDQGIGMSSEVLDRLFQPFEQADSSISRRFGGSGLGLHISWTLAELMGGSINVESEEGVGSRFLLRLPYRQSELEALPPQQRQRISNTAYFHGRVLLVEDAIELQMLGQRMLEAMGIEVEIANHGQEGLEMALQKGYDLILMDMQMPVMDGITATRSLRDLFYRRPIIALTANAMKHHREQFSEAGCDGFLSKPIVRQELNRVLNQYLQPMSKGEIERLKQASGNTPLIDDQLLDHFIERMGILLQELVEALNQENWEQIQTTAHTLKGCGGSYGFHRLTDFGKGVCDALHMENRERAREQVEALVNELERITIN